MLGIRVIYLSLSFCVYSLLQWYSLCKLTFNVTPEINRALCVTKSMFYTPLCSRLPTLSPDDNKIDR